VLRGLDEKKGKITTKLVEEVAEVLAIPDLECKLEVLRAVSYATDREGTRLEGCHCHRHLLDQPGPYAKKLAAYRKASEGCINKGRGAPELAGVGGEEICHRITNASDKMLRQRYAVSTESQRRLMAEFEISLKQSITTQLREKLLFWCFLPYLLIALLGDYVGVRSLADCKEAAKRCLAEAQRCLDEGLWHKMHRVGQHFLAAGSALRRQIEAFATTDSPLQAWPHLLVELLAYALIPIVCRRIEGVHSELRGILRKVNNQRLAMPGAKLRRNDTAVLLDQQPFVDWVSCWWKSRNWLLKSVRCIIPAGVDVYSLGHSSLLGFWYQSSYEARYTARPSTCTALVQWGEAYKQCHRPIRQAISASQWVLVRYLKAKMAEPTRVFSIPSSLFPSCDRLAIVDDQSLVPVLPSDQPSLAEKMAEALVAYDSSSVPLGPRTFWSCVQAYPEGKVVVRPSHRPQHKHEALIVLKDLAANDGCPQTNVGF